MASALQPSPLLPVPLSAPRRLPNTSPRLFSLPQSSPRLRLRRPRSSQPPGDAVEPETPSEITEEEPSAMDDAAASATAEEIKRRLSEARASSAGGDGGFWGGVAEEVGAIEWPAFGKVLGTTGVVLSVIAGSSVALLTVNAILAELSDRLFAGKGMQDFF